MEIRPYLRLFL